MSRRALDPHLVTDQLARALDAWEEERCPVPNCGHRLTPRHNPATGKLWWICPAGHQHTLKD